jgi:hypothetical protein
MTEIDQIDLISVINTIFSPDEKGNNSQFLFPNNNNYNKNKLIILTNYNYYNKQINKQNTFGIRSSPPFRAKFAQNANFIAYKQKKKNHILNINIQQSSMLLLI